MMGVNELVNLFLMASRAVLWRHNDRDKGPFMLKGVLIALLCLMALKTADLGAIVFTVAPLLVNADISVLVAANTFLSGL